MNKKNLAIIGSGIGISLLSYLAFNSNNDNPSNHIKENAQIANQKKLDDFNIRIIHSEIENKVEGIEITINKDRQRELINYSPIYYEIPEMNIKFYLPLENGMIKATSTFGEPKSIDGMVLYIYGKDPETNQHKILFKRILSYTQD